MQSSLLRRARMAGILGPVALLAACAQTPMGPTVQVMPGPNKPFEAFQSDQAVCKQFAEQSVAGQAQNANNQAVGAGVLTTVLGAGLGAAIGGVSGAAGAGAAIGAGAGALGGASIGASSSSNAQYSIQQQYNNAYVQCMYSNGNQVPSYGGSPPSYGAPPPPPYGVPPPYGAPPPYEAPPPYGAPPPA